MFIHRIVCYGGRHFSGNVAPAMDQLLARWGFFMLIHGAARGADTLCGDWGLLRGLPVVPVAAPWHMFGSAAGGIRNGWIVTHLAPTYAVEWPGGNGTADMRRRLERAGVVIWRPMG